MTKHGREHWGSRLGFVLAAIGSAIGLGTLWKFPYVTGANGGGLFILIYLVCTVFIGIPVLISELLLGRRAQRAAVGIFATLAPRHPQWRVLGWLSVVSPMIILSFYHVVGGWGLNYVLLSLAQSFSNRSPDTVRRIFDLLYTSGSVTLLWQFLFTLIVVGMVMRGVRRGIEYWAKVMTIGLFLLLIGLLIYSMTLEGFPEAVRFVLRPDPGKLRPSGVLQALGLAFFTLSVGQGVMLTYGSYLKRTEDIPKTALIVGVADVLASMLIALMLFPIIFTFGFSPEQGEGLVFKTLPVVFGQLPASLIISTVFFVLFSFTSLTSAMAMLEAIVANFMDLQEWSRKKAALVAGLIVMVLGIPCGLSGSGALFRAWPKIFGQTYFQTSSFLVDIWILPILSLLISLFIGWYVDKRTVESEFRAGSSWGWLYWPWRLFVRWIVPIAIVLVILQETRLLDIDRLLGVAAHE